jgi:hypothetical protein
MVMLGALGAVTATLPADVLLAWIGWRELFLLFSALSVLSAALVYLVVPEAKPAANRAVSLSLKNVYADPRFWRVAPLSASCIGTAWALQGLWAAQWLADVDGFDRAEVVQHLFGMAVALSLGAILLGSVADRLRRRGVGPEVLLGFVAAVFIATQFALVLDLPIPIISRVGRCGGGRCGYRAQLCDFGRIFPQRAGWTSKWSIEPVPHRDSLRRAICDRCRGPALGRGGGTLSRHRLSDSLCSQPRISGRRMVLVCALAERA